MKLELRQWIRKQRMFLILLIAALMGDCSTIIGIL